MITKLGLSLYLIYFFNQNLLAQTFKPWPNRVSVVYFKKNLCRVKNDFSHFAFKRPLSVEVYSVVKSETHLRIVTVI